MTTPHDILASRVPTQERGRRRVSAIRKATLALLATGHVREMKMSDVARVAGVAVGTIYHYFPSKEALLLDLRREIMERASSDLATVFTTRFRETRVLREALRVLLNGLVDLALSYQGLERAIHGLIFENPAVAEHVDAQERHVRRFVSRLISGASAFLRPGDPDRKAFMLVTLVDAAVVRIMRDPVLAEDPDWIVDEIVRMVDHYLTPDRKEALREG